MIKSGFQLGLLGFSLFPVLAAAAVAGKPVFSDKVVAEKYADHVLSTMRMVLKDAEDLKAKIAEFTAKPNEATHEAAKKAWKQARISYSEAENFRFYGGPIDDPEQGVEGFLNAWPIDESYIDYNKGNPNAGIINDAKKFPKINRELLLSLNEKDGEKNISTGFHAIEFLLWGEDVSLEGAGERSHLDYVASKSKNAARRAQYLNALVDLLVEHVKKIETQWSGDYRKAFLAQTPHESATKIMTGITSLLADELAGERMMVALEKQDPENEQDCFSDFSVEDLVANLDGAEKTYVRSGMKAHFTKKHAKLALKIQEQFADAKRALAAIDRPLDKTISPSGSPASKKKVQVAIDKVQLLAKDLALASLKDGIELNIETN